MCKVILLIMQMGPDKPLEWTGLLKVSCSGIQALPATQVQRSAKEC